MRSSTKGASCCCQNASFLEAADLPAVTLSPSLPSPNRSVRPRIAKDLHVPGAYEYRIVLLELEFLIAFMRDLDVNAISLTRLQLHLHQRPGRVDVSDPGRKMVAVAGLVLDIHQM